MFLSYIEPLAEIRRHPGTTERVNFGVHEVNCPFPPSQSLELLSLCFLLAVLRLVFYELNIPLPSCIPDW